MQYVQLGSSGLTVSRICLGTMSYGTPQWREWVLSEADSQPFFRRAVELGVTFFDSADMYSLGMSEEVTGRALREYTTRDEVVIATKVYFPMGGDSPYRRGLSRKHVLSAIDESLRRLGTDYVDLYQIHRYDPQTPDEEMLRALEDIVRSGRARYIGASSMYAWQFGRLLWLARELGTTRFISMQNHYNAIYREEEREMLPLCRAEGIGVIPWSPLARGAVARPPAGGDSTRARTDTLAKGFYGHRSDRAVIERVQAVAERRGVSQAQIGLAWLLHQPGVTAPIVGATKLHHMEEACAAVDLQLSDQEIAEIAEPYEPHPVVGVQVSAPKPASQRT